MKKGMYVSLRRGTVGRGREGNVAPGGREKERWNEGRWEGDDGGLEEVGICDLAFGGVTMVVTVVLR